MKPENLSPPKHRKFQFRQTTTSDDFDPAKRKAPPTGACGVLTGKGCKSGIVANGFNWAAFLGFFATGFFFRSGRLLVDKGIAAIVIAFEIVRGGFAAQIAVNALIVHVVFAGNIFRIFVRNVSHKIRLKFR
jgi:hypothetical protein